MHICVVLPCSNMSFLFCFYITTQHSGYCGVLTLAWITIFVLGFKFCRWSLFHLHGETTKVMGNCRIGGREGGHRSMSLWTWLARSVSRRRRACIVLMYVVVCLAVLPLALPLPREPMPMAYVWWLARSVSHRRRFEKFETLLMHKYCVHMCTLWFQKKRTLL